MREDQTANLEKRVIDKNLDKHMSEVSNDDNQEKSEVKEKDFAEDGFTLNEYREFLHDSIQQRHVFIQNSLTQLKVIEGEIIAYKEILEKLNPVDSKSFNAEMKKSA